MTAANWSMVASLILAAVGILSFITTKNSGRGYQEIGATMLATERLWIYHELTPIISARCVQWYCNSGRAKVTIRLEGPPAFLCAHSSRFSIQDDVFRRDLTPSGEGGPTVEDIRNYVWSPYRLVPGLGHGVGPGSVVQGADETGRSWKYPCEWLVGTELHIILEPTRPPSWSHGAPIQYAEPNTVRMRCELSRTDWPDMTWVIPIKVNIA